jgi:hypothetical protein
MKVNDPSLNQAAASRLGRAQEAETVAPGGGRKAGGAAAGAQTDQVQLSGLLKALRAESSEREGRIERLAAQCRAGRLEFDVRQVSRRLVDDALEAES